MTPSSLRKWRLIFLAGTYRRCNGGSFARQEKITLGFYCADAKCYEDFRHRIGQCCDSDNGRLVTVGKHDRKFSVTRKNYGRKDDCERNCCLTEYLWKTPTGSEP
jgi:hypothetical protein